MVGWIVETTLIAAGIAFVALVASRVPSIGPTVRHALWLVVLIKLITPPLVTWPWASQWRAANWPIRLSQGASRTRSGGLVHDDKSLSASTWWHTETPSASASSEEGEPAEIRSDNTSTRAQDVRPLFMVTAVVCRMLTSGTYLSTRVSLAEFITLIWLAVSVMLGGAQTTRIIQFRRRLQGAIPAADELVNEAELISRRLAVSMPELLVVPGLGTPLLWCLGRPRLLLPARLVKSLSLDQWRGILTHELAHLRRGDHWVNRLELAAGLIWWWNPIYWLTRARLDAEAELACDAWVVWALPKDRLSYAEVLLDICATVSLARPPTPTLSVTGSGQFFERRLSMILRGDVPRRFTPIGLMAAFVLLILAVPSWSAVSTPLDAQRAAAILFQSAFELATRAANADGKLLEKDANKDAADDEGKANDGKNNSTVPASPAKVKARSKVKESDLDIDVSAIEKEIESKFGPGSDFEKKMEAFAREIEAMFGSGSDFEKRMEAFGKDMEAKFGSGSDFEKRMEAFGKDVEARLGPGSDFEKKIEAFGKDMEAKFGPRSDFAEKIKNESRAGVDTKGQRKVLEKRSARMRSGTGDAKASAGAMNRRRERRIQELEAQIDRLVNEIKALKSDDTREKDENQ